MLLPENPAKKPGLWDAIATQLSGAAMCFIIKNGIGDPSLEAKMLNQNEAEFALARLREAHICRVSANRSVATSPHFAGKLEGDTVLVTEFLTSPSTVALTVDVGKLQHDLETAVISLLFTTGGVKAVLVPLTIAPWEMQDADISSVQGMLIFRKRA